MPVTFDEFTAFLGKVVVYGAPVTAVAVFAGKRTAEKWIDSYFTKRQKTFEHEQAKEIQRLKVKIDTVIQGALRMQEREFKIIPEAWEKVSEAYAHAQSLTSPMQSHADLEQLSPAGLEEFMTKAELSDSQKQTLRSVSKQSINKEWQTLSDWRRRNSAFKALAEADNYVKINGVFIPTDLHTRFLALTRIIHETLIAWQVGTQAQNYKMINDGHAKLSGEGLKLHQAIEQAIRKRLTEQTVIAEQPIA
jgi:hypothetical protein